MTPAKSLTNGKINPAADPERAAMILEIYGSHEIPLLSPIPTYQSLPIGERLCYLVNLRCLTPEQRQRLVSHIAGRFNLDPTHVDSKLDQVGVPVLADNITVTSSDQGLLFSIMDGWDCDEWGDDDWEEFEELGW